MDIMSPAEARVVVTAERLGLRAFWTDRVVAGKPLYGVTVERKADDWSLPPTEIAIGRYRLVVARKAIDALQDMAPRLQKALDAASPEPPDMRIAAGIGGDGVVTALRVERDGSVRLHPDDIEAIAEALASRFSGGPTQDGRRPIQWPSSDGGDR